jgi:hypothetical protein
MSNASSCMGVGRPKIDRYLDTNVPSKGFLFYSKPIYDLTSKLVK